MFVPLDIYRNVPFRSFSSGNYTDP